jgi:hypothetical protein
MDQQIKETERRWRWGSPKSSGRDNGSRMILICFQPLIRMGASDGFCGGRGAEGGGGGGWGASSVGGVEEDTEEAPLKADSMDAFCLRAIA